MRIPSDSLFGELALAIAQLIRHDINYKFSGRFERPTARLGTGRPQAWAVLSSLRHPIRRALSMALFAAALIAGPAHAETWKDKYLELVMALVPAKNATGTLERFTPFVN